MSAESRKAYIMAVEAYTEEHIKAEMVARCRAQGHHFPVPAEASLPQFNCAYCQAPRPDLADIDWWHLREQLVGRTMTEIKGVIAYYAANHPNARIKWP